MPLILLPLLFLLLPIAEIYVIIQVGQVIGPWWTVLLLVAVTVAGAWLVRREGRRAWEELRVALRTGRLPARELADAALVLVGGSLLITPGFITDVFGLFLVLPMTRPIARRALAVGIAWWARRRQGRIRVIHVGGPTMADAPRYRSDPEGRIIRGEVTDD